MSNFDNLNDYSLRTLNLFKDAINKDLDRVTDPQRLRYFKNRLMEVEIAIRKKQPRHLRLVK